MKFLTSICIILILIVYSFVKMGSSTIETDEYANFEKEEILPEQSKSKNAYSIKNKISKAKNNMLAGGHVELIQDHKERLVEIDDHYIKAVDNLRSEYHYKFRAEQVEFSKILPNLQRDHEHMISFASLHNIPLSDKDFLSPQMTYFLMFTKNYSDPSEINLDEIGISNEDWIYVRRFVNSELFVNLLSNNKLSTHTSSPLFLKDKFTTRQDIEIAERLKANEEEKRKIASSEDPEIDY